MTCFWSALLTGGSKFENKYVPLPLKKILADDAFCDALTECYNMVFMTQSQVSRQYSSPVESNRASSSIGV